MRSVKKPQLLPILENRMAQKGREVRAARSGTGGGCAEREMGSLGR